MELRQLKYFISVAETLNFSEAARSLCVTQSTLSQQIRQLEAELGAPLLVRNSHSVTLSEAGNELLPYARQTVNDAEMCLDRIHDLNGLKTGELNIGVTYSFSPILTETLLMFIKEYPGIKLNIIYRPMEELMDLLRHRDVDFVLAFRPSQSVPGVESHVLFQNRLAAIVSDTHWLSDKDSISLEELEQCELALPSRGLQARNAFEQIVAPYQNFKVRMELNEVNILLRLVRQSNLVTVLAQDSIYNMEGVKALPIDVPENDMEGCVHLLKDSYRKFSMQKFIRMLEASIAVKVRRNNWL